MAPFSSLKTAFDDSLPVLASMAIHLFAQFQCSFVSQWRSLRKATST